MDGDRLRSNRLSPWAWRREASGSDVAVWRSSDVVAWNGHLSLISEMLLNDFRSI